MASELVGALDHALDVQKLLNCDAVELDDCSLYPFMTPSGNADTWKRFELLPTPPLSPGCTDLEQELGFLSTDGWDPGSDLLPSSDTLELVSEFLREQEERDFINDLLTEGPSTVVPGLRQDCMWSAFDARAIAAGIAAEQQPHLRQPEEERQRDDDDDEEEEAARLQSLAAREEPASPLPDTGVARTVEAAPVGSEPCFPELLTPPAAAEVSGLQMPAARFSPCRTPAETEPPTDSEEEIDVVTVEKRQPAPSRRRRSPASSTTPPARRANTNTAGTRPPQRDAWGAARHGCHIPIHQQHNYAAPSPPSPPPAKRPRWGGGSPGAAAAAAARFSGKPRPPAATERWGSRGPSSASSSAGSSSGGSDTEESERRRTHNILERQRRDGLRSSFVALRDSVPELRTNDRAAKVLILRKAAELARSLGTDERRLEVEKCRQEARRRHLLAALDKLKKASS